MITSQLHGLLAAVFILHGILVIVTRRSLFYWTARLFDLFEAMQRATWISMAPWLRSWRRQLALEMRGLAPVEKISRREMVNAELERLMK